MTHMEYPYRIYVNMNTDHRLEAYQPGDPLVLAGKHGQSVQATSPDAQTSSVLEAIYGLLNMDSRPNRNQAPSLSVGDVILIGEMAYSVRWVGFEPETGPLNLLEGVYLDHEPPPAC